MRPLPVDPLRPTPLPVDPLKYISHETILIGVVILVVVTFGVRNECTYQLSSLQYTIAVQA